jgi:hypothetical protein
MSLTGLPSLNADRICGPEKAREGPTRTRRSSASGSTCERPRVSFLFYVSIQFIGGRITESLPFLDFCDQGHRFGPERLVSAEVGHGIRKFARSKRIELYKFSPHLKARWNSIAYLSIRRSI